MKKILAGVLLLLSIAVGSFAGPPPIPPSVGSGTGDIVQSGSTSNHQWGYFTADKTLAGKSITASKPVCSDANGDPGVCAGTEGIWLTVAGKAADADKLDNHDSTYFQVDLGLTKGTLTDGKYCTYTASGNMFNCTSDGGTGATIDDTKGNGDTTYAWSADKIYDQLALKQDTISSYSTIVALFGTGSCTGYLKSDGSCDTPSGAAHDALTLAGTPETNVFSLSSQALSFDTQTANYIFAGPATGAAAAPTFRAFVAADFGTTLTPQFARLGLGGAADGTNVLASTGFSVDPDGDVEAKSVTVSAATSPTVTMLDSDAPGTDKEIAKSVGAYIDGADGAENGTYSIYVHQAGTSTEYIQADGKNATVDVLKPATFASTITTTGNIELGNASDTTLARVSGGVVSVEGVNVVTTSSSDTLTNKTFNANGTGNTLKGYGYITFTKPHNRGSATAAVGSTETTQLYGVPAFADDVEANNYVDYIAEVPQDIDTAVDLAAYFKFRLGGADTGDHDYIISMVSIADSAAAAGTPANAVNLDYTADGNGADGDIETATGTLTDWKSNITAGSYWLIRVTRDGDDGTNDASTVDSYPMSLTIRYGFTQ